MTQKAWPEEKSGREKIQTTQVVGACFSLCLRSSWRLVRETRVQGLPHLCKTALDRRDDMAALARRSAPPPPPSLAGGFPGHTHIILLLD